jgi:hypothetical protein
MVLYLFVLVSLIGRMDCMIVSKFKRVWTSTEMHTLDVPLSDSEFHTLLHPCFTSSAWEYRGQWAAQLFQSDQEREPEW